LSTKQQLYKDKFEAMRLYAARGATSDSHKNVCGTPPRHVAN